MARNDDANSLFEQTSFLYGGNAHYIEEIYADWRKDPTSVSNEWQQFFDDLGDDAALIAKNAEGASWEKDHWPLPENGELTSALTAIGAT